MSAYLADNNYWLNANNQIVFELNAGGPTHYYRPDDSETPSGTINGVADRFVELDIQGYQLNTYLDQFQLPNGNYAYTFVQYDNSQLLPFEQLLIQYILSPDGPHDEPLSVFRHSGTFRFIQQDGHGNDVDEQFVDGRLRQGRYDHADGTQTFEQFDQSGNLTHWELIHTQGPDRGFVNWTQNGDGSWSRDDNSSVTRFAAANALQQIANEAAGLWAPGATIAAANGQLVLHDGGLLINDNFQYVVSNDGGSLIGQDAAGIIPNNGANIINNNGNNFISDNASALINQDGAGLIAGQALNLINQDGAGLINQDGAGLINQDGAGLIGNSGSTLINNGGSTLVSDVGSAFAGEFAAAMNPHGLTVGTRLVNALVFADTNFNGQFDKGEPWTITDANGHYAVPGGSGPLTVLDGKDAGTNLPFTASFEAPVGSSIISPLTTLTTELWRQTGSVERSLHAVDNAFGLANADLTKLDPVGGIQNGDPASAAVYVAGAKVFDTIDIMAGALKGVGADIRGAGHAVVLAMVDDIAHGGTLNLNDSATVASLFTHAASSLGFDGSALAASVARIVTGTNAQLDAALHHDAVGPGLLTDLTAVETNVQGSITSALIAAGGNPGKVADVAATVPAAGPSGGGNPFVIDGGRYGDVGGDHRADIVLHEDSGPVALWQVNGGQVSPAFIGGVGPEWHIDSAAADFNGDGKADVLWRANDGSLMMWQMNGTQFQSSIFGKIGNEWHLGGTGDFNGDGKDDILWSRDDGSLMLWQMNGSQIQSSAIFGQVGHEWHGEGIGDFNGDGKADILARSDSGQLGLFFMNGGQIQSSTIFGQIGREWHVEGVADFNGDGKADILWKNDSGLLMLWQMNGANIQSSQTFNGLPADWHVYGTGDFNGDGNADILWRNDNGAVAEWDMNGPSIVGAHNISPLATDWNLGVHHFDFV